MSTDQLLRVFRAIYNENEFANNEIADKQYKEHLSNESSDNLTPLEIHSRQSRSISGQRKKLMKRLRNTKLLGRPFVRPLDYKKHPICVKCDNKRSSCFRYRLGTYGLCTGAWLVAGAIGTAACQVVTMTRNLDCTINAWFNCFINNCGLVAF